MKKLITVLFLSLFYISSFAQFVGTSVCGFSDIPKFQHMEQRRLELSDPNTAIKWYDHFENGWMGRYELELSRLTLSFWDDDKLYVISYDDKNFSRHATLHYKEGESTEISRDIYLYCYDFNDKDKWWHIASEKIRTDYRKVDKNRVLSHEYTYQSSKDLKGALRKGAGIGVTQGYIEKKDNGKVKLRLIVFTTKDEDDMTYSSYDYHWEDYILVKDKDGIYKVRKDV